MISVKNLFFEMTYSDKSSEYVSLVNHKTSSSNITIFTTIYTKYKIGAKDILAAATLLRKNTKSRRNKTKQHKTLKRINKKFSVRQRKIPLFVYSLKPPKFFI